MLHASIFGLRYCRLLLDHLDEDIARQLASEFDYSFVVNYGDCEASTFETIRKNACVIDLSKGLDHTFSKFQASTRNQVRRTEKMEQLRFQSAIQNDFSAYFDFYKTCENARKWYPVPEEELNNSLIFTAFFDERPISGMSVYTHEGRLRVGRIFSLKRLENDPALNNLVFGSAAKRLVYEICRYGAAHGFHSLDLGGIDLNDDSKAGLSMFKSSFGGEILPVTIARYRNARFLAAEPKIREAGYDIT